MLDLQIPDLPIFPLPIGRKGGDAKLNGKRKTRSIAQPAAILACLGMQRGSGIGCFDIMGTNVQSEFTEEFARSRLIKAAEQKLLDDILKVDC